MRGPHPVLRLGVNTLLSTRHEHLRNVFIHGNVLARGLRFARTSRTVHHRKLLGVDARVVQELRRHASFRTTMDSYTQALDEPKRQAQERLA
jgi:integrase